MYVSHNEVHPHLGFATPYPDHWTNRDEATSLSTHSLAFLRTDKVCALLTHLQSPGTHSGGLLHDSAVRTRVTVLTLFLGTSVKEMLSM